MNKVADDKKQRRLQERKEHMQQRADALRENLKRRKLRQKELKKTQQK